MTRTGKHDIDYFLYRPSIIFQAVEFTIKVKCKEPIVY